MKYPVYCVRDIKVGFQPTLMVEMNDATAVRGFSYTVNNPNGIIGFSPKDFDLFKIGVFNTDDGKFNPILPEMICSGISVFGDKE